MKQKNLSDIFNIAAKWRSLKGLIKDKGYKIPLIRKILYVLSVIYVISPIDFIPAFLLPVPVGVIDDIGVLAFFLMLILYEIDQYENYLAVGGAGKEEVGSKKGKLHDDGKTIDLDRKNWKKE
ncbi:MAG: DUF1232 domain-containing protein [Deltaproteobacteria bacterium]|uniref:DUF1232 domain-containing protein n=1 Tax=Candidatus Zymogenus saltonus TaxID=2844893 RepID=A0A9D8PND4_9DELT|nr:DUF1232 domain-containing protein [Candidatus Zymogenus saltonus]